MDIYKKTYRLLYQIVPDLDRLPISREPFLITGKGNANISLHIRKRSHDRTEVAVCHYRQTGWAGFVPAPDVELRLFHGSREAVPFLYIDSYLGRVELNESGRRKCPITSSQVDFSVYKWLTDIRNSGLQPRNGFPGPGF